MQETYADKDVAECAVRLNREAYKVVSDSGIRLQSLPSYPKERLESFVNMPIPQAAGLLSMVMTGLSSEPLYGSILQSIKRGKRSEIDYINGEIVRLADENGLVVPLNRTIVSMVHRVEKTGQFMAKEDFLKVFFE